MTDSVGAHAGTSLRRARRGGLGGGSLTLRGERLFRDAGHLRLCVLTVPCVL